MVSQPGSAEDFPKKYPLNGQGCRLVLAKLANNMLLIIEIIARYEGLKKQQFCNCLSSNTFLITNYNKNFHRLIGLNRLTPFSISPIYDNPLLIFSASLILLLFS